MAGRILIVDDEADMLLLLKRILNEESTHEVVTEPDPQKALALFSQSPFDMVITDLKMAKMDGIRFLEAVKQLRADVAVVIMTAYATIETAVEATRKGAYDYITKPFRRERILMTVEKVMQWQAIVRENQALRDALAEKKGFAALVGASPSMQAIFDRIRQVAPTMATVLITGPSGTGKELVAQAIHQNSRRGGRKMVTINCTAIPEHVLESELFGHVKGAFTGAWQDKKGLVEEAHESTLFLDEIGDLSPTLQTKLLRLLQEGEYKPVGSVTTRKADLRFIAATNHDLKADIEARRFREDLYYRLNVIRFDLPPLKERHQDIPLLCRHFLEKYARLNQKEIRDLSANALQALMGYDFPGNVRELENIIERGVIFCHGDTLRLADLFLESGDKPMFADVNADMAQLPFKEAKDRMTELFHRQYVMALLQATNGNVSRAAEQAGIQRQYFHRLMKEAGIEAEGYKQKGE
ncbi:MAG: sigma-54 dependent transcriptional regulator [Desulfatitalea sp.]